MAPYLVYLLGQPRLLLVGSEAVIFVSYILSSLYNKLHIYLTALYEFFKNLEEHVSFSN